MNTILKRAGLLAVAALAACSESVARTAPTAVTGAGGSTPTVAVLPSTGEALVAWVETRDSVANVYLARRAADGRALGEPVRVNAVAGDASTHEQAPPQVEVGPGGEVYVVWQRSYSVPGRMYAASDLRMARSSDGGRSFEPALTVNDDAGGPPSSHTFHDVAVAPDGTVYVSWLDSRETDRARAAAAASGAGAAHAHGHGGADLPGSEVRLASWRPGEAGFGASLVVDGDVCPCCRTSLAVAPDGALLLAWRKVYEGNVRDVVLARSDDGGRTFGAPVPVHRDGWVYDGCPHAGPSVALDEDGRVYLAWYTGKEGRQGLYYAVSADGGRVFGAPRALLTGDWVPPSQVKLATTPAGVWAAWDDRREEARRTHLALLESDGPRSLAPALDGHSPSLASAGASTTLVWLDGEAVRAQGFGME